MTYVRPMEEILASDPMRVTDAEVDAVFAWLGAPDELRDVELVDVPGLPDVQRCALSLVVELAGDGGALIAPLDAISYRLGWSSPDEHEELRLLGRTRVRDWLGSALRALCARGFLRII